ncbi:MAG TPA: hypothetical protein VKR06_31730 [Ktedonosporobacter sp.]|nr:hypothetical protein [Ktedonosporobacter sp.]
MPNQSKLDAAHQPELAEEQPEEIEGGEYVEVEVEYEEEEEEAQVANAKRRIAEPATGIMRFLPRSRKTRVTLALVIIGIMVILAFFAPPEGDSTNVSGDQAEVPTVAITNQVESIDVNRSVDVKGIHITVQSVMIATKFSDDRKRAGNYTVRVQVQAKNSGQSLIGLDYASIVKLVLPGGVEVAPKYLSVAPEMMAGTSQTGYIDFPISSQISASSLSLRFDTTGATVPFGS